MQAYLPYLGWGLFSVVTVILVFREHRASGVGQSLQTAMQDLTTLKTSQSQLQVCCLTILHNLDTVCCCVTFNLQVIAVAALDRWLLRALLPGID